MAATSFQPARIAGAQWCNNALLVEEIQFLRIAGNSGDSTTRNVAPGQWLSRDITFRSPRRLPAKLGDIEQCETWERSSEGNSIALPHPQRERQELLWKQFFMNPTVWLDCRLHKKTSSSPDFRHKVSKESLWLNNVYKPAWVETQLATLGAQMDVSMTGSPTSNSTYLSWIAGYDENITVEVCRKHCEKGQLKEAIDALDRLQQTGYRVPSCLFSTVVKGCLAQKNLVLGRRVHVLAVEGGLESNTYLANQILRMYCSHGRLQEAIDLFTKVTAPDAFTWSSIILAHAEHGRPSKAIQLYHDMRSSSVNPDGHVFVAALKACAGASDLESGRKVHADILESGIQPNIFVGTCLVDMYAKCDRLEDARRIFEDLPKRDVVTWTAMIAGYAEHGRGIDALALYDRMEQEGITISNRVTFTCLLKACSSIGALQQGKQLHLQVVERGFNTDIVVGTCLVNMYAKCGSLEDARKVFDSLPRRDIVTWTAMIGGYAEHGHGHEALALYAGMKQEEIILADNLTFVCLLKACTIVGAIQQGKQLHSQILKKGLHTDIVVGSCLVDMYAKCGSLEDAQRLFDDMPIKNVITWNSMIYGYTEYGRGREALSLYAKLEQDGSVLPDSFTFSCLVKACASIGALKLGKQLHLQILERGLKADIFLSNCLIDMYAKCGSLDDARMVFNGLATRDVVTWNSMINCYTEYGLGQEALALYAAMMQDGNMVTDNHVTFASLIRACTSVGALQQGKELHAEILEAGLEANVVVGSSLVDMYAKCGSLEDACKVFSNLPEKDVIVWNSMINGWGQSNQGRKAIECFQEMLRDGVEPNATTFVCLFVACSHEGLINEGRQYFNAMVVDHRIVPSRQHYMCMADLLGRSGHLQEAEHFLLSMPFEGDIVGWMSLLNACRSHNDLERGRRCFENLIRLDPQNAGAYVLIGNMYADSGRWSDVDQIESLRRSAGANKKPAAAGIEVNRQVHTFVVGEARDDISSKLRSINLQVKDEGAHVPHTELVLKPVGQKEREDQLCGHAEKLALAYGLMNTPDGTALLVTKNLRMCWDCHSATKVMSRIEKREIVVRDAHRVHRFLKGSCSCGDRP